jgi:hypothetical protein
LRAGALALTLAFSGCAAPVDVTEQPIPASQYVPRTIEGWEVRVNRALLGAKAEVGEAALKLLEAKLYEITRMVPEKPLAELRKVPIWLGVDDGPNDRAQYHPSADWLSKHRFNPEKAKGVEIGNAARFLKTAREQPAMVLHELAHGFHDQVLGMEHAGVHAAFEAAQSSKKLDDVLHYDGKRAKAYALENEKEFFAEMSEAWWGTNDFQPFVRAEVQAQFPEVAALLPKWWGE